MPGFERSGIACAAACALAALAHPLLAPGTHPRAHAVLLVGAASSGVDIAQELAGVGCRWARSGGQGGCPFMQLLLCICWTVPLGGCSLCWGGVGGCASQPDSRSSLQGLLCVPMCKACLCARVWENPWTPD